MYHTFVVLVLVDVDARSLLQELYFMSFGISIVTFRYTVSTVSVQIVSYGDPQLNPSLVLRSEQVKSNYCIKLSAHSVGLIPNPP